MKRIALAAILIFTAASGIDDGGPVNPTWNKQERSLGFPIPDRDGISIRDYFAASVISQTSGLTQNSDIDRHVDFAYRIADAMIQRRKR